MRSAIVPALLLGSLVFVAILYLNATSPDLLGGITGDRTTDVGVSEQQQQRKRLDRINALLISDRNKDDLRSGRIFWGAAQHMIELAFNDKPGNVVVTMRDKKIYEFHTYTFNGVRDPIILEFQNNKLACAHYPATETTSCNRSEQSYYTGNDPLKSNYPFSQPTQR